MNMIDSIKNLASKVDVKNVDFGSFTKNFNLGSIIMAIIIIIIGIVVWSIFKALRKRYIKKNGGSNDDMSSHVLYGIVKALIMLICFLCLLQNFGVNVTNAVAGLGVAGIIVGFALQDFLKDVIMGLHIMADKFFNIGDAVEFNGEIGIVKKFSLRTTEIELITDRSHVSICNRQIEFIKRVSDQVDIDIPLSYNEDVRKVHEVLTAIANKISEHKDVYSCKYKGTEKFDESAIIYKIRFFCNPTKRFDTRRAAMMLIQDGLNEAGIAIPFKQIDIHMDK